MDFILFPLLYGTRKTQTTELLGVVL